METFGPLRQEPEINELVSAADDILGSTIGAGLGLALGGPPGSVVGAAAGPAMSHTLKKVGREVARRMLSRREQSRIGTVFVLAAKETRARLDAGEQVRADGFFDANAQQRSTAEEITEGVFLAAQREYEEHKLSYLASLLSGLAFSPGIDRAHAVSLLRLAQALSYRQLCVVAACMRPGVVKARSKPLGAGRDMSPGVAALISEICDLGARGVLLGVGTWDGGLAYLNAAERENLTLVGEQLYSLMGLGRFPQQEIDAVLKLLPADSSPSGA